MAQTLAGDEAAAPPARVRPHPWVSAERQNLQRFSSSLGRSGGRGCKGRGEGQKRVRTARGREGSGEHEGFIMQTRGQVSSAPVRRDSGAGRECQAPEGSPRRAPTRASSASSSSSILRELTRFPPLPPDRRTCFSAQRCPRPQVPSLRTTRVIGRSATRVAEALLEQASTLSPKLGVPREGKRALQ